VLDRERADRAKSAGALMPGMKRTKASPAKKPRKSAKKKLLPPSPEPVFQEWPLVPAEPLSDWERFWLAVSDFWEKLRDR